MGCVIADMRQDFVQTINATLSGIDLGALTGFMQTHVDDGLATLEAARTHFERRDTEFTLDMAYLGQTHTVSVTLPVTVTVTDGTVTPRQRTISRRHSTAPTAPPMGGCLRMARDG